MLTGTTRKWNERRRLQKTCQARLTDLGLPHPLVWTDVVERIEAQRGRELWVGPTDRLPLEITGVWVGCCDRDYVYYRADLVGSPRGMSVGHEFCHIICKHTSADVTDQSFLRRHFPELADSGTVEHLCYRSDFQSADEREAETMATLLLPRFTRDRAAAPALADVESLSDRARVDSIWRS